MLLGEYPTPLVIFIASARWRASSGVPSRDSNSEIFLFFKVTKLPYHLVTPSHFRLYRRVTELLDFWDTKNLTSSGKPCFRPLKKYLIKCIFLLVFYESNKYLKGTLFSLKMQYLNKQGQQASSKIFKHLDEVIARWRSYTIWRYLF